MTDTSDSIAELAGRLEKATGPSLDLDGRVWCAVNGFEFVMWDGAGCVYRDNAKGSGTSGISHASASTVRPFTASIDDAISLTERLLPGAFWHVAKGRLRESEPLFGAALFFGSDEELGHGEGHTAPIAIILATLRSLSSTERQ